MERFNGVHIEWSDKFRQIIDEAGFTCKDDELFEIAKEFEYLSKQYGKIIISEKHFDDSCRSFKRKKLGFAGGEKYIIGNIFFKFATDIETGGENNNTDINNKDDTKTTNQPQNIYDEEDDNGGDDSSEYLSPSQKVQYFQHATNEKPKEKKWMYGGSKAYDIGAMKAASNEMKGLLACYNCKVEKLYFPLMCTIDYRGYRLIAVSTLKIIASNQSNSTLVYGSDGSDGRNAPREVKIDASFFNKMEIIGNQLKLAKHPVLSGKNKAIKEIIGPIDIEGHCIHGHDYLLDFGRIFPPEQYLPGRKAEKFYHLFRPEFMKAYSTHLSSDALCSKEEGEKFDLQIKKATNYLKTNLMQKIAKKFLSIIRTYKTIENVTQFIHAYGLNCRHLGLLRQKVLEIISKQNLLVDEQQEMERICNKIILSEIVARSLKIIFKYLQRQSSSSKNYVNEIESFAFPMLNNLMSNSYKNTTMNEKQKKLHVDFSVLKSYIKVENNNNSEHNNDNNNTTSIQFSHAEEQLMNDEYYTPMHEILDLFCSANVFDSVNFWNHEIFYFINHYFMDTFLSEELKKEEDLCVSDIRDKINIYETVKRLCELCGIKLRKNVLEEYKNNSNETFTLLIFDIKKLSARVQRMDILGNATINLQYNDLQNQTKSQIYTPEKWEIFYRLINSAIERTINQNKKIEYFKMLMNSHFFEIYLIYKKTHHNHDIKEFLNKTNIDCNKTIQKKTFKNYSNYYNGLIQIENGIYNLFQVITSKKNLSETICLLLSNSLRCFNSALKYFKQIFKLKTDDKIQFILDEFFFPLIQLANVNYEIGIQCNHKQTCVTHPIYLLRAFFIESLTLISIQNSKGFSLEGNQIFSFHYYFHCFQSIFEYVKSCTIHGDPFHFFTKFAGNFLEFTLLRFPYISNDEHIFHFPTIDLYKIPSLSRKIHFYSMTENNSNFNDNDYNNDNPCSNETKKTFRNKGFTEINSIDCLLHFIPFYESNNSNNNNNFNFSNGENNLLACLSQINKPSNNVYLEFKNGNISSPSPRPFWILLSTESFFIVNHFVISYPPSTPFPDLTFEFTRLYNGSVHEKFHFTDIQSGKINPIQFESHKPCNYISFFLFLSHEIY